MKLLRKYAGNYLAAIEIYRRLEKAEKERIVLALVLSCGSGICDLATYGIIGPFSKLVVAKESLERLGEENSANDLAGRIMNASGSMTYIAGFAIAISLLTAIRLFSYTKNIEVSNSAATQYSTKAFKSFLEQQPAKAKKYTSSEIMNIVVSQGSVAAGILLMFFQAVASLSVLALLSIAIATTYPGGFVATTMVVGGAYIAFGRFVSPIYAAISSRSFDLSTQRLRHVQEGYMAHKDIYIDGTAEDYAKRFVSLDSETRKPLGTGEIVRALPKYILDCITVIGIGITLVLVAGSGDAGDARLGSISALAYAVLRIIASLQTIWNTSSYIRLNGKSMDKIKRLIDDEECHRLEKRQRLCLSEDESVERLKMINYEGIVFGYNGNIIVSGLSVTVRPGSRIQIAGRSGCGKSTLMDIIIGVLEPTAGRIRVNGRDIVSKKYGQKANKSVLRGYIAHASQSPYLFYGSILENIVLGKRVDRCLLEKVIYVAGLASIIDIKDDGVNTHIGEMGASLSGGQKQRIALARALYKDKEIIATDEITSGIDEKGSIEIYKRLDETFRDKALILISHGPTGLESRLETVNLNRGG